MPSYTTLLALQSKKIQKFGLFVQNSWKPVKFDTLNINLVASTKSPRSSVDRAFAS